MLDLLKTKTFWTALAGLCTAVGAYATGDITLAALIAAIFAAAGTIFMRDGIRKIAPVAFCVLMLGACTATTYNIDFHTGAFRVADEVKVKPGQAGDDGSSTAGGATAGGEKGAPGGSNVLDGFAQQGNIFQIGTAASTEGSARAAVQAQSPNSNADAGGDEARPGDGEPEPEPQPEPDGEPQPESDAG